MPRGFGIAAVRRANFKMPPAGNGIAAAHFTTQALSMGAGTLAAADLLGTAGGFSTFTVATSPEGPFAATVDLTETTTCYLKAASPYRLVKPQSVTVS